MKDFCIFSRTKTDRTEGLKGEIGLMVKEGSVLGYLPPSGDSQWNEKKRNLAKEVALDRIDEIEAIWFFPVQTGLNRFFFIFK